MKKDFKILDNILGFRPWREPSVPAALNAASAIQSGFYLNKKDKCRMNEKVSVDKYVIYFLSLKSQKISKGVFTYDVRCFWVIFDLPTYTYI